jgi:hypothetical protein
MIADRAKDSVGVTVHAIYFVPRPIRAEVVHDAEHVLGSEQEGFRGVRRAVPITRQILPRKTRPKVLLP